MGGTESDRGPYDVPPTSPYGVPVVASGPPTPVYGTPPVSPPGTPGSAWGVHDDVAPVQPYDVTVYPPAPTGPPPPWLATRTDQVPPSSAVVVVAWVVTVFTSFYLLPWAIAATRGKAARWGIFWVNLLLGWTLVGWVATLVWACLPHGVLHPAPVAVPPGWYPLANGRYGFWDGTRWTGHVA
ncbi:superinfection immunity protein [Cellulomonas gelida]|uniref:DUF2510 domain-containing protein n=1 Tax=Cellulomonas gelida TaxID=1712 RepID=A0A4Y3KMR9_9CELL|nr:superinfection immunity protein [Cellulomonas gelida]GEA85173.1 hypothetical protein CGE01nite_24240 [Cellulomonas gelida]GGL19994.1 hypothetical protein GCM10009774_07870 [Cellulomonas gelida]